MGLSFFVADEEDEDEWWKSLVSLDELVLRDKLSRSLVTLWIDGSCGEGTEPKHEQK